MTDQRVPREVLERGLNKLYGSGVPELGDPVKQRLLDFVDLLLKWNRVYNLTAVRTASQMVERHLLDSLIMCRWMPGPVADADSPTTPIRHRRVDVMDIGTGAGLPVLPLAMVRPDLSFLSVESNGKKTRFQQQAVMELGIHNVTVEQARIQTITQQATTVLSRAFTAPADFLNIARELCVHDGTVLVMLGVADLLPVQLGAGYELMELVEVDVPGTESARHVAVCRRLAG